MPTALKRELVNPTTWSTDTLVSLGDHVIHELALNSVGIDTSYRITLGRCLLAVEQTQLFRKFGCSGAVHYAVSRLGVGVKHARALRRVAKGLEALPRLSHAAERGEIPWGKLREIVSKASVETEQTWLELSRKLSYAEIERLVRATEYGGYPWDSCADVEPDTKLRLHFGPEMGEIFERARTALSERFGQPVTVTEALEHLSLEFLAGKTLTAEKVKNAKVEARRGSRVAKWKNAELVNSARSLASDQGALWENALGTAPMLPSEGEELGDRALSGEGELPRPSTPEPLESSSDGATKPLHGLQSRPHAGGEMETTSELPFGVSIPPSQHQQRSEGELRGHARGPEFLRRRRYPLRFRPSARSTTPAQRRELLRRDGFCCSTPGCPNRHWLQLHHVVPFAQKGPTQPDNLITLCSRCHKHYHDGHLRIVKTSDAQYTFQDAQGNDLAQEVRIEIAGWINFWLGWEGGPHNCYIRRWAMSA